MCGSWIFHWAKDTEFFWRKMEDFGWHNLPYIPIIWWFNGGFLKWRYPQIIILVLVIFVYYGYLGDPWLKTPPFFLKLGLPVPFLPLGHTKLVPVAGPGWEDWALSWALAGWNPRSMLRSVAEDGCDWILWIIVDITNQYKPGVYKHFFLPTFTSLVA